MMSSSFDGPMGGGTQKQQSYTFDAFGNLTNIAGTIGRATPTSAQTNRLNGTGTVYDAAGNLKGHRELRMPLNSLFEPRNR
ncbi:MAG TPA: hypothetical protein VLB76_08210 [Thermoanaerobaculia bacterium]|jgi:hypothetical protein|nr:hypothetical protein [Thermoanaerobaculia bacterium]